MNEEESINIRAIQHYMYCPRRFALLELNCDWAENAFVVKANLMHENVHSGGHKFSNDRMLVRSSVSVYNDEYNIFGVTDCMEFVRSRNGVSIDGSSDKYIVRIVEYKPKPPKDADFHDSDAIQVFAQKICADSMWKCGCEAYLYYSETRKRVRLPFDTEFDKWDSMLKEYLAGMRKIISDGVIPPRAAGVRCSGCSLKDVCFPKVRRYDVHDEILKEIEGEIT